MIRALVSKEKQICILWSPKAGSATACEIFFKYCNIDYSDYKWIHDARIAYQNKFYREIVHTDLSSFKIFQIVRNPYSRSISSYYHYLRYCGDIISYKEYLLKLLEHKLSCETGIYHSCIQFMTDKLSDIIKLENIDKDILRINSKFNISLQPAKYDRHSWKNKIDSKQIIKEIPIEYQKSYEDIIDAETTNLVSRIYHKDIEYFQYDCPYTSK